MGPHLGLGEPSMKIKFFFMWGLFVLPAAAQVPNLPTRTMELPILSTSISLQEATLEGNGLSRKLVQKKFFEPRSLPPSEVVKLTTELDRQFTQTLSHLKVQSTCGDPRASLYALALQVKGELQRCGDFARHCAGDKKLDSPQVLVVGGLCESMRQNARQAYELFEAATDKKWHSSSDIDEVVFQFASFAMYGVYEDQVDAILSRHPRWSAQEQFLWKSVLLRMGNLGLSGIQKPEVDQFLKERIKESSGRFQALLKAIKIRIAYLDYDYDESLYDLVQEGPTLENPLLWYDLLYANLYYGLDQRFREARLAYDTFDRYAHRWLNFPVENNTYNYTEIYGSVCRDQVLQGAELQEFSGFKERFRNQSLSFTQAFQELHKYRERFPDKADVLTAW